MAVLDGPACPLAVRWHAWDGPAEGSEHLNLTMDGDGVVASGIVIGTNDGAPFGLRYILRIDALWRLRDARVETTAGKSVHLESDGEGRWRREGVPDTALRGGIDIDIEATPFTNTLPIRRLALAAGECREITLAYVSVPSLEVAPARQRYTALVPGELYRFESLAHSFTADLPVDRFSLVLDYPGLFRRTL